MLSHLKSQFHHPRGLLGHLVGYVLAAKNQGRLEWALAQLQLQPSDAVLDIGFGPGTSLEKIAQQAATVAGVDISDVMVGQARRRNQNAIQAGRVIVKQGTAENIPFADGEYTKVLAVNSLHHWDDVPTGLHEVLRVLQIGGMLAIVEQPPFGVEDKTIIIERGNGIIEQLQASGFTNISAKYEELERGWAACITGYKA